MEAVSPGGSYLLAREALVIAGDPRAWESPLAEGFVAEMAGVGFAVRQVFQSLYEELAGVVELELVDVPGPQAWKATLAADVVPRHVRAV